jgi:hypothetical protein
MDPSDVMRKVVENNLRVVWRGSQRVNLSVCVICLYVMLCVMDDCKKWRNCGWRWDNIHNSSINYNLCISLLTDTK